MNLGSKTAVTCIIEPWATPSTCITAPGTVTVSGNAAVGDCSGLATQCPNNDQMAINDRIPCQ
jgi:hypothetical protein